MLNNNKFTFILVMSVFVCGVFMNPIEDGQQTNSLNSNSGVLNAVNNDADFDPSLFSKNRKLHLNYANLGDDLDGSVEEIDLPDLADQLDELNEDDFDKEKYFIRKSAPRRIFIGKRYQDDYDELDRDYFNLDKKNARRHLFLGKRNQLQNPRGNQGKRNGQIHRIFIGKRGDIKRIFIG